MAAALGAAAVQAVVAAAHGAAAVVRAAVARVPLISRILSAKVKIAMDTANGGLASNATAAAR